MDEAAAVEFMLERVREDPSVHDETICAGIVAGGGNELLAELTVMFAPEAFVQVMLPDLKAAPTFDAFEWDRGRKVSVALERIPVFVKARELASRLPESERRLLASVAGRSATANAVQQMTAQGSRVENLILTPCAANMEWPEELADAIVSVSPIENPDEDPSPAAARPSGCLGLFFTSTGRR